MEMINSIWKWTRIVVPSSRESNERPCYFLQLIVIKTSYENIFSPFNHINDECVCVCLVKLFVRCFISQQLMACKPPEMKFLHNFFSLNFHILIKNYKLWHWTHRVVTKIHFHFIEILKIGEIICLTLVGSW